MKRLLLLALAPLAIGGLVTGCNQSRSPGPASRTQATKASPAPGLDDAADAPHAAATATRLTVYSGDYDALAAWRGDDDGVPGLALVHSQVRHALKAGDNLVTRTGWPRALDVAAVALRAQDPAITVAGQRYLSPPTGGAALLRAALGKRVVVEHTSGGTKQTDNGILVAGNDALVLALPDGRTKVIRNYDNFSLLDVAGQPTLAPAVRWQIHAPKAGDARFTLSYPTGGLAWRAEYRATLSPGDDCMMSLDGAAMVVNRSGVDFDRVALTLVAGEPNRIPDATVSPRRYAAIAAPAVAADAAGAPLPRRSGEYQAYRIPGDATLADGGIERVALFPPQPGIACKRTYETMPATGTWDPPRPLIGPGQDDASGPQPVKATVSFDNTQAAGLGRPLPAGRVRLFDGEDLLGESRLSHTPEGADLHLDVGTAFDLTAERTRTAFDVDRGGRNMTETFAITLRNARTNAETITVVEPLPRWNAWEIVASSVPATRRDAQHAQFEASIPAKGQTVVTYTVRYRWPQDVKP